MAMVAEEMAQAVINNVKGCNEPTDTNNKLYKAVCDYVESHADVIYSWAGTLSGVPDPVVTIKATIKTAGNLVPTGATTPESAMSAWSTMWNTNAATWMVVWPSGFALSPAFIIPTINFTLSGATEQLPAITHICQEIINGIKKATPSASGSHVAYTGVASFTEIL